MMIYVGECGQMMIYVGECGKMMIYVGECGQMMSRRMLANDDICR
jgi:hypothetical protein